MELRYDAIKQHIKCNIDSRLLFEYFLTIKNQKQQQQKKQIKL